MSSTLFFSKVLNLLGSADSHASAAAESLNSVIFDLSTLNKLLILRHNFIQYMSPAVSSNFGIVNVFFVGASLLFEHNRFIVVSSFILVLTYIAANTALLEASAKFNKFRFF